MLLLPCSKNWLNKPHTDTKKAAEAAFFICAASEQQILTEKYGRYRIDEDHR